jgi:hypothetical protein
MSTLDLGPLRQAYAAVAAAIQAGPDPDRAYDQALELLNEMVAMTRHGRALKAQQLIRLRDAPLAVGRPPRTHAALAARMGVHRGRVGAVLKAAESEAAGWTAAREVAA